MNNKKWIIQTCDDLGLTLGMENTFRDLDAPGWITVNEWIFETLNDGIVARDAINSYCHENQGARLVLMEDDKLVSVV